MNKQTIEGINEQTNEWKIKNGEKGQKRKKIIKVSFIRFLVFHVSVSKYSLSCF